MRQRPAIARPILLHPTAHSGRRRRGGREAHAPRRQSLPPHPASHADGAPHAHLRERRADRLRRVVAAGAAAPRAGSARLHLGHAARRRRLRAARRPRNEIYEPLATHCSTYGHRVIRGDPETERQTPSFLATTAHSCIDTRQPFAKSTRPPWLRLSFCLRPRCLRLESTRRSAGAASTCSLRREETACTCAAAAL